MDSRYFFWNLRTILIVFLSTTVIYAQEQTMTAQGDDSSNVVERRINTLVDNILSSIHNEIRMTLGQPSEHTSFHEEYLADSTDTYASHDEFTIDGTDSTIVFEGNTIVGINDTIQGVVVVRNGSMTVNGVVEGDVTVQGGDIIINRGGVITGCATAVAGHILKDGEGIVGGIMYETEGNADDRMVRTRSHGRHFSYTSNERPGGHHQKFISPQFSLNWITNSADSFEPFTFRFNRVDGLFLGIGKSEAKPWEAKRNFAFYGSLGYGFALHRWRYNLGWDLFPGPRNLLEAGVEYHYLTDTRDSWIMNRNENTAAAFFIHEDFFDYYERRGFDIHGSVYPMRQLRARIDYLADDYKSLPWKTDWALFGGKKHFRRNPLIFDGLMRSIVVSLDYSTTDYKWWERSGWDINASAEYAGYNLGGDFSFNRYLFDIRRYQCISTFSKLSARVRVGSSSGHLPYQKTFEFGGIGTLNAFPYKEFFGNRMVLANFEYLIHGKTFDESDFLPLEILSPFSLILFLDAGWADYVPSYFSYTDGFKTLTWNALKSDVGFGIGSRDGTLRVAWAWRTDQRTSPVFFFRISRPF